MTMDQINPTMVVIIGFIIVIIVVALRYKQMSATVKGLGAMFNITGKTGDGPASTHPPAGGIFKTLTIGKSNLETQGTSKIEELTGIGDTTAKAREAPSNAASPAETQKPPKRK
jgi:hypothetical protein